MPTPEQMDGLLEFIDSSPSPPPPVFVGRQDVIRDIEKRLPYLLKTSGRPKETRLIYGAPGAGKSSILAELEKRGLKDEGEKYNVLVLNSERLDDMDEVMESLSIAAGLSSPEWRKILLKSTTRGTAGAIQMATGIQGIRDAVNSLIDGIGGVPRTMTAFAKRFPASMWQMPLVVAIDEAQRLSWTKDTKQAFLLQSLHDNDPALPIMPIFAGLGDIRDTLSKIGLTRIENTHEIGCLTNNEMDDFFIGFSRKFGLFIQDDSNRDHVIPNVGKLMRDSHGWPRHLYHSFQALGNGVRPVDGDLSRVNWPHVHEDALGRRQAYYRSQSSPEMKSGIFLTAAVMDGLRDGMKSVAVNSLIRRFSRDEEGWRLPKGMEVGDFREHLIHKGALQERENETFYCPLPSFRTYLTDQMRDPE